MHATRYTILQRFSRCSDNFSRLNFVAQRIKTGLNIVSQDAIALSEIPLDGYVGQDEWDDALFASERLLEILRFDKNKIYWENNRKKKLNLQFFLAI